MYKVFVVGGDPKLVAIVCVRDGCWRRPWEMTMMTTANYKAERMGGDQQRGDLYKTC